MKPIFCYIFVLIVISGCGNHSELLGNGLTKSVTEINEYSIKLGDDSSISDTISHTYKKYNENDKLIQRITKMQFEEGQMEINYFYNSNDQLQKEILNMSDATELTVNHTYKDSLLYQSKSFVTTEDVKFEGVETYYYNEYGVRQKSMSSQLYIDLTSNDTITNSRTNSYYNTEKLLDSSETIHTGKSNRNRKWKYEYDYLTLIKQEVYNQKDSLISSTTYKYKRDKFDNWIEKTAITDGIAKHKIIRELIYK